MWCRVFLAPLLARLVQVGLIAGAVLSVGVIATARAVAAPTPHCVSGPCRQPETWDVAFQGGSPFVLTNFGLLTPQGTKFEFACEETFGGMVPDRFRFDDRGRLFIPSRVGIFISSDGCTWERPAGELGSIEVFDVALDPKNRDRVWALAGTRRTLYRSEDGGKTFAPRYTFAERQFLWQIRIAPSNPDIVYVAGYGATAPFVLAVSTDGGASFRIQDQNPFGTAGSVAFLGVAPDSPQTVYLALQHEKGDQVWKSSNEGRDPVKLLTLQGEEAVGGFAFGPTPETLYVSGRSVIFTEDKPTARLYISRNAGQSWEPPVASGPRGPFLRCLSYRAGTLYSCGAGTNGDDEYLVAASNDDGKSWQPLVRLQDMTGVRACAAQACQATSNWLCESHQICSSGPGLPEPPRTPGESGCGCTVGAGRSSPALFGLGLIGLWAWRRRRSRRGQA